MCGGCNHLRFSVMSLMQNNKPKGNNMKDKDLIKLLGVLAAFICMVLILSGCAGHQKGDTYKVQLGRKCADNGTIQSFVWFHTTIGEQQVSKANCQ